MTRNLKNKTSPFVTIVTQCCGVAKDHRYPGARKDIEVHELWEVSTPESRKETRPGDLTPNWGHPSVTKRLAAALAKDPDTWTAKETLARIRFQKVLE